MRLLGNVDLRTSELPNSLEFTASREDGLIETIAIPLFALIVLWMFWRSGTLWLRIIAGFAAVSTFLALFANWIQGGETRLRVTSERGKSRRKSRAALFHVSRGCDGRYLLNRLL
jgi:hypothetical protein